MVGSQKNSMDYTVLQRRACAIRQVSLQATTHAGAGHPTSALSCADILAVLYFHVLKIDERNPLSNESDRFVLSKGHAAPALYAVWQQLGWVTLNDVLELRRSNSPLEGHPTYRAQYAEVATGSLGMGLSMGLGMAHTARVFGYSYRTFVVLGDSELEEGSNWESFSWAGAQHVANLVAIIDVNALGQRGTTLYGHNLEALQRRIESCNWQVYQVDGHNIKDLVELFDALDYQQGPICILARTIKGYGIAAVEGQNGYHGRAFTQDELIAYTDDLHKRFECPAVIEDLHIKVRLQKPQVESVSFNLCRSEHLQVIAPRKAFGVALAEAGAQQPQLMVFDAEVSNSTYTDIFAHQHSERFVEGYIAEQNIVGMAIGTNVRGIPTVVATFAAFFTRAFDQIRMSVMSATTIVFAGSHAGCSIGSDGASQMGLEDIALFRSLPESCVLYPCDGVSTAKLLEICLMYQKGNSYIRLTRAELPPIYPVSATFALGGSHVVVAHEHDQVLIVAAGVTVHEAIKAATQLQQQNIQVAVLDLYSIKPLDVRTLKQQLERCKQRLVIVEDHYQAGGIGEAVAGALQGQLYQVRHLYVRSLPHSGTMSEVLHAQGIDTAAIIQAVLEIQQSA